MEEKENIVENLEEVKEDKKVKKEKKKNNKEIEKLQEEKNILNDKLLRVSAEMQNMKRRYEDEITRIYRYEGEFFIKKTLGVLDNFERAINMDNDNLEDEVSKFLNGFKLIYNELKKNLEEIEVVEINCLNEPFNPETMEAVMTEVAEGKDSGIVTEVMLKGYKYKDKVIRPAMVKVNE
ncbi:MAG: nucleotide exchange factor GrpE [Firmicutes bacterium]|nr:nucleotide exchange factor GrpE [Bacillota bacterium]